MNFGYALRIRLTYSSSVSSISERSFCMHIINTGGIGGCFIGDVSKCSKLLKFATQRRFSILIVESYFRLKNNGDAGFMRFSRCQCSLSLSLAGDTNECLSPLCRKILLPHLFSLCTLNVIGDLLLCIMNQQLRRKNYVSVQKTKEELNVRRQSKIHFSRYCRLRHQITMARL